MRERGNDNTERHDFVARTVIEHTLCSVRLTVSSAACITNACWLSRAPKVVLARVTYDQ